MIQFRLIPRGLSKADPSYASLEWSAIQTLFEKASFDVLLLLDCCAAASDAPTVGSAVTETIAACGFESIAPQPGRYSFTNTLIEVLEDWCDGPPFSAAMLHNKVLSVLKHERPERAQDGKRRRLECRRTPIHIVATADPTLPSIELGRRNKRPESQEVESLRLRVSAPKNAPELKREQDIISNALKRKGYEEDSLNSTSGDDYNVPRVIISLTVDEHQTLDSESCQKWLTSCPTLVKYAKIEAVYKSFSAFLLLSIPVFIWNLLPENPACSFVGYATSKNLLKPSFQNSVPQEAQHELAIKQGFVPEASRPVLEKVACRRCRDKKITCDMFRGGCSGCKRVEQKCTYQGYDSMIEPKRNDNEALEKALGK